MRENMAGIMAAVLVMLKGKEYQTAERDSVFYPIMRELGVKEWLWVDVTDQIEDVRWIFAGTYRAKGLPYVFWYEERRYLGLIATREQKAVVRAVQGERERRLVSADYLKGDTETLQAFAFLEAQLVGLKVAST